jgi:PAS domain-containing protein
MEYRLFLGISPFIILAVLFLLALSFRKREYAAGKFLFVFVLIALGYMISNVMEFVYGNESWILLWTKLEHLFASMIPVTWLLFVLQFTGKHERLRPRKCWYYFIPAFLNVFLSWSNEAHHVFWKSVRFEMIENIMVIRTTYGLLFYVVYFMHYVLLLYGIYIVLSEYIRSSDVFRRQLFWIIFGIMLAMFFNILYVFRVFPWLRKDFTPIGYALGSIAFAVGMFRYKFLELMPVSRSRVFDYISEGILVIDRKNRVIDMNSAALRIIGRSGYEPGTSVYQYPLVSPFFDDDEYRDKPHMLREEIITERDGPRRYEIGLNVIKGPGGGYDGAVIVMHDITERVRLSQELKTLRGIVPICAKCKNIRTDQGYWQKVEAYVSEHSYAEFSHGICPSCMEELYPEIKKDKT